MSIIFKEELESLKKWLDKYPPFKKLLFILFILILILTPITVVLDYVGVFSIIWNNETEDNQPQEYEIEDLKNFTLDLCDDIRNFMADRDENRPDWEDYGFDNKEEYDKAKDDFDDETLSLFKKHFSSKAANCYYEFEKRGITDYYLIFYINDPANIQNIERDVIPRLESLAHQL